MADERQNPVAFADDQIRVLVLLHQIQMEKLRKVLVRKGIVTDDEWDQDIDRVTEADIASALLRLKDTPRFRDLELS